MYTLYTCVNVARITSGSHQLFLLEYKGLFLHSEFCFQLQYCLSKPDGEVKGSSVPDSRHIL